jgi:hypothetical protein
VCIPAPDERREPSSPSAARADELKAVGASDRVSEHQDVLCHAHPPEIVNEITRHGDAPMIHQRV